VLSLESQVAGQAYFITNDDPQPFWGFVGNMLEGLGYPPKMRPHIKLPYILVYVIALLMQSVIIPLVKPFKAMTVEFTPSAVTLAACTRRISCRKAREHFDYVPKVSMEEAQRISYQAFPELRYRPNGKKVE
jgi:sterol-4alpha-carboxylate 3-dehydrogenase (decarboxylating)